MEITVNTSKSRIKVESVIVVKIDKCKKEL